MLIQHKPFPKHLTQSFDAFAQIAESKGFNKRTPEVVHFVREVAIVAATDVGGPLIIDLFNPNTRTPTPAIPDITYTSDPSIISGSSIGADLLVGVWGASLYFNAAQIAVLNRAAFVDIYSRSVMQAYAGDDRRFSLRGRNGLLQLQPEISGDAAAAVNANANASNEVSLADVPLTVFGQGQAASWIHKIPAAAWPAAINHTYTATLGLFVARK